MPLIDKNNLEKVDLGNDEWVKIPMQFSYGDVLEFQARGDDKGEILVYCIREWSFDASIVKETVLMLDLKSIEKISTQIYSKIDLDKKKQQESSEPLPDIKDVTNTPTM